jgi:hypothetical protein
MAKTLEDWRKMEAEELRKRDINQRKALTVSDWRKEQARQERENLRLSKLHTKLTLGEDWREREAAKRATPEYRASKAQEALAERASVNRSLLPPSAYAPLPEEGKTEIDLPGGGKATFGAETLRNIRAAREVPEQQKAEGRRKVGESINRMYAEAYEKNKQRYEQELADRGLRSPLQATSPQERRRIEEENSRELMADFRTTISAKDRAAREENQIARDYRDYKRAAQEARKRGAAQAAVYYEGLATDLNESVGGNISNVTARRRILEQGAMDQVRKELQDRTNIRRKINAIRTSANPEGGMFEMTQPATGNVWTQPFDLTAPTPSGTVVETTPITQPTQTATEAPRKPSESEVALIEKENKEMEIINSLDEDTRGSLLKVRSIKEQIANQPKPSGRGAPSKSAIEERNLLQSEISKLKEKIKELQNLPHMKQRGRTPQKDQTSEQISILKNELGAIEKFFL